MDESRRIVLLGKTGAGKSSLANTIFGEAVFMPNNSFNSGTKKCQAVTRSDNGRNITLIDTPGFFDTDTPEEEMKPEILRCIIECAPGPHAFLIVLKVERFTEQEQAVVDKIYQYFSADAFKYAAVVFTRGDQLPQGEKIEKFVSENKNLRDLVEKCGGRCHVVDNKYWKNKGQNGYRNNQLQVAELLNTIDKMTKANQGSCYTNEMIRVVNREIQREKEQVRQTRGKSLTMSQEEIGSNAKISVFERLKIRLAGIAIGALMGVLLGAVEDKMTGIDFRKIFDLKTAEGGLKMASNALSGGMKGYTAAEEAKTPGEAMEKAAKAVCNNSKLTNF